ncbi:MAG: polyphosphate kinase 2 family protein [Phycisphaerales bacterium]
MGIETEFRVEPGQRVTLDDADADRTPGVDRDEAERSLARDVERIRDLQHRLYAEGRRSLLVVLQGMDAAGKDGTIRHVFGPSNPQGVRVAAFGSPTSNELARDYLWRVHQRVPERGHIGVFNRSHYEDVLIVRVLGLVPEPVWRRRYEHINAFERMLSDEGVMVLKFFLHVSAKEQLERLLKRVTNPAKAWKYNAEDFTKRSRRPAYLEAYQDALRECSTDHAPWHVIPADKKWFRNYAIARIVADRLEHMDPELPELPEDGHTWREKFANGDG